MHIFWGVGRCSSVTVIRKCDKKTPVIFNLCVFFSDIKKCLIMCVCMCGCVGLWVCVRARAVELTWKLGLEIRSANSSKIWVQSLQTSPFWENKFSIFTHFTQTGCKVWHQLDTFVTVTETCFTRKSHACDLITLHFCWIKKHKWNCYENCSDFLNLKHGKFYFSIMTSAL